MNSSLQHILDELEIRKIVARVCRGVDRMDLDLLRSCFHSDAALSGGYEGGIEDFIEYCRSGRAPYISTTHFIGNQLIEVDGDAAWAESYVRASHRLAGQNGQPDTDRVAHGRYIDRFERREGKWRIASRIMAVDSDRVDIVTGHWVPETQLNGRRDRSDPSYSS